MRTGSQARFSTRVIIGVVAAVALMSLIGWRIATSRPGGQADGTATTRQVGSKATEGLRLAGADNGSGSLHIVSTDAVLGEKQESENAQFGGASVDLNVIDHTGETHSNIIPFQLNTEPGKPYEPLDLVLSVEGVSESECIVSHKYAADERGATPQTTTLTSAAKQRVNAYDGSHMFKVVCDVGSTNISTSLTVLVADNAPKKCKGFAFTDTTVTAGSADDLRASMAGTWEGCVQTPWMPAYYVTIQFKPDGTYSAVSDELLDNIEANALYYGTENDSPLKTYAITDAQGGVGKGTITVLFDAGTTTIDTVSDVKLMGDKLAFTMYHTAANRAYGPLTFQLYRK